MSRRHHILRTLRFAARLKTRAIAGRIVHELLGRILVRAPWLIRPRPVAQNCFADPNLAAFARQWAATSQRFSGIAGLENGRFEVKGVSKDFGTLDAMEWTPPFPDRPEYSNWAYDFAFFSYAPILVHRDPAGGIALLRSLVVLLEEKHPIAGRQLHFVWDPIVVALRIMGLCTAAARAIELGVSASNDDLGILAKHVALCAAYLDIFCERYLGYNHEAFGLAALCVADLAVHKSERSRRYGKAFARSLQQQFLTDGLQGERTATYHIHVLLLSRALLAANYMDAKSQEQVCHQASRMLDALDVLVHPDGEIALFNDCAIEDSVPPAAVGWRPDMNVSGTKVLPMAGYAKLWQGETVAILDAGKMGPDAAIGHGHADFLSCEVSLAGRRVITDPGVFSYEAGSLRDHTRSAVSHNGPSYEGLEPAELFGAWRVGWRGVAKFLPSRFGHGGLFQEAGGYCTGYRRWGGHTARWVAVAADGAVRISDYWRSIPGRKPRLRFLVPGDWTVVEWDHASVTYASVHAPDLRFTIASRPGRISAVNPAQWRPKGAMIGFAATEVLIDPEERDGMAWTATVLHAGTMPLDLENAVAAAREFAKKCSERFEG